MTKILYFEDDQEISIFVKTLLESSGYVVEHYYSGKDIIKKVSQTKPDLILLDLTLPDADGIDVCRELKSDVRYKAIPIIILTARVSTEDKIVGFECGADDYMTKPFSPREVVARVKAILRRSQAQFDEPVSEDEDDSIRIAGVKIYPDRYEVYYQDELLELTPKEFELLLYLAKNKGRVLTRDQLLSAVWNYDFAGDTRIVDVHISHLRDKIEQNSKKPTYIKTIRGLGYKLEEPKPE